MLRLLPRSSARPSVALALVLAAALVFAPVASAVDKDYYADDAAQESLHSEMVVHPSAVRDGSVVYLAWQGPAFDIYAASYDESTTAWTGPVRVGQGPLKLDGHGAPALSVDAEGYLHIMYGAHWTPILHAVALAPHSVTAGFRWLPAVTDAGTYPEAVQLTNGQLMVFWRQSAGSFIGWMWRISSDGGVTWGEAKPLLSAPVDDSNWYLNAQPGPNGSVLVAFIRRDLGDALEWYRRHDVYYMWRDVTGAWRNARNDLLAPPMTVSSANAQCLAFSSTTSALTNEVVVRHDPSAGPVSQPAPMIQFVTGASRGVNHYAWKFGRWDGSAWEFASITGTDHGFDSGTFEPHADGSVDSYLVAGSDPVLLDRISPYEGRGGRIEHWRSPDRGASWSFVERVSPDETGTIYADPQVVVNGSDTSKLIFTEWTNDASKAFQRLYLWGSDGFVKRPFAQNVTRLAGFDRVATAIAVSKAGFPESASTVVLATSFDYPDALAAAPLANALEAPLLLTPGRLTPAVAAEIRRLGASHAVILGSTRVMSGFIESDLKAQTTVTSTERLAGADRYGTALAVARRLGGVLGSLRTAVVVSGRNFPDALSAGPFAAYSGYPVILASGDSVPHSVYDALSALGISSTIVVGGPPAVSDAYMNGLPSPTRLAGPDRYATSAEVARYTLAHGLLSDRLVVASGANFPDALAGAVLGGRARGTLLLTHPSAVPTVTAGALTDLMAGRTVRTWVLGGEPAISSATFDAVRALVTSPTPAP